jgi:hypothetical protein
MSLDPTRGVIILHKLGQMNYYPLAVFLLVIAIIALSYKPWMLDALVEAIDKFRGGGPPTPMHPLPSNDGALLRRKRP